MSLNSYRYRNGLPLATEVASIRPVSFVNVSVDKETIWQFIQENWQWIASSLAATIIALAGFLKWLYPLIKSRSKRVE